MELFRPPYRQLAWRGTVQDFRDVISASSEYLAYARPVSNETAGLCKLSQQENDWEPFGKRKLAELLPRVEYEWRCRVPRRVLPGDG